MLTILIININYFSTIAIERYNPLIHGNFEGLNPFIWFVSMTFLKQRFMSLFCLLFGAGVLLMYQANQNKGKNPTAIHYQRMFWLMLFGIMHAYLVWDGDILVSYALCGALIYWAKNASIKFLLIVGAIMTLIPAESFISSMIANAPVTAEQLASWHPNAERLQSALSAHNGSWWDATPKRIEVSFGRQTSGFVSYTLWRGGGLMLIGMALLKSGFLTAQLPTKIYRNTLLITAVISVPLSIWGTSSYIYSGYDYKVFGHELMVGFYFGSLIMSFSYLSLLLLIVKSAKWQRFKAAMTAVGKMAITNYLSASIICSLIFFGHGLGLYGQVDRTFLMMTVIAIWTAQISFSLLWLKHYHYGPVEWIWRCLTYRQLIINKKVTE